MCECLAYLHLYYDTVEAIYSISLLIWIYFIFWGYMVICMLITVYFLFYFLVICLFLAGKTMGPSIGTGMGSACIRVGPCFFNQSTRNSRNMGRKWIIVYCLPNWKNKNVKCSLQLFGHWTFFFFLPGWTFD